MKKKILNFVIWLLLAVVSAWVTIITCLVLYLQVSWEKIPFLAGFFIFILVFLVVIEAAHISGVYITEKIHQRIEKTPC